MTAFGIIHRFQGGTREQYESALNEVHPDGGKALPLGQMLHVAGPTEDGWVIIAVHESKASWEHFRDGTLVPGLEVADNAFQSPPEEISFEVSNFQQSG